MANWGVSNSCRGQPQLLANTVPGNSATVVLCGSSLRTVSNAVAHLRTVTFVCRHHPCSFRKDICHTLLSTSCLPRQSAAANVTEIPESPYVQDL